MLRQGCDQPIDLSGEWGHSLSVVAPWVLREEKHPVVWCLELRPTGGAQLLSCGHCLKVDQTRLEGMVWGGKGLEVGGLEEGELGLAARQCVDALFTM